MGRFKKWLMGILLVLILGVGVSVIVFWHDIQEIRGVMKYANVFKKEKLVENFRSLYQQYPSTTLQRTDPVYLLPVRFRELPISYVYSGETKKISD